ncbi:MAG: plasmid mobilization relaxosome protein MobC [Bacteroidota bacterium]
MARPSKQIKRAEKVTVRYTKVELRLISKYADRSGISMAEFVRAKSLDHQIRNRLTEEEADYYRKLVGMANNLNQLAHLGHIGKLLTSEILKTLERVNQTIDKLQ